MEVVWRGVVPNLEPGDRPSASDVLDYLANMEADVEASYDPREWEMERVDVIDERLRMWRFTKIDWGI